MDWQGEGEVEGSFGEQEEIVEGFPSQVRLIP